jgi:hypothetical protein
MILGVAVFVNDRFATQRCKGVYLFQSYGPYRVLYADLVGSILDARIMFKQFNTLGVRQSHSSRGKLESVVASATIKASLSVQMARSAALTL